METDEGEDVPPGPSQGGEEGAPTTGDEGSTGQDPQAPAPQGEGEKGKGSEEKKKYDDEKFIKQREAFLAAAIPGGRERLKEMAKRAPEKPKKGSVKVNVILCHMFVFCTSQAYLLVAPQGQSSPTPSAAI